MPNNANIDERVVEMQIDNRQFIDGANKTISVLDRLKDALNFKNSGDGLDDLQRSVDRFDLTGLASDVEAISSRFSTLGIIGAQALKNLTDKAVNFISNTVRGLTIDPISGGFQKYNSILQDTYTILSATRSEDFSLQGFNTQLDYVNENMELMMWYADETSATISDMTNTIGKLTNSGQKLSNAAATAMGIYNVAYSAGATKNEAGRALYNFAQAMSAGSVKLIDWRSIENANMATLEFKNQILEVASSAYAAEHGFKSLEKQADGTYKTLDGVVVTAQNFSQTLQEGWFNSSVLEKVLTDYGEYSRRLQAVMSDQGFEKYGFAAQEVIDMFEKLDGSEEDFVRLQEELRETMHNATPSIEALKYAYSELTDSEIEVSRNAHKMGSEYHTFNDVIEATKDAVSTGWARSFQTIIGDADKAKLVWKAVGDEFYEIFASGGATRNAILGFWANPSTFDTPAYKKLVSGRDSLLNAIKTLYEGIKTYISPIVDAFHQVFNFGRDPEKSAVTLLNLTYAFERFSKKVALSDDAVKGMTAFFKTVFEWGKKALGVFRPFMSTAGKVVGYVKELVESFFAAFKSGKFDKDEFLSGVLDSKILTALTNGIVDLIGVLRSAFSFVSGLFTSVGNAFSIAWEYVKGLYGEIKAGLSTAFGGDGVGVTEILKAVGAILLLKKGADSFSWLQGILSLFRPIKDVLTGIHNTFETLGDTLESFSRKSPSDDLKKIAIAVGILTVSLVVLASVDADRLGIALAILAGGMLELVGAMKGLKFISGKKGQKATKGLISLASAILIMSLAIKILSALNPDAMMNALGGIFVILAELLLFLEAINLLKIKPKSIRGLISLSIAMLIFSGVVWALGSLPYDKLKQGLTSLAIALAVVSVAMIAMSKFGGSKLVLIGIGMLFMASAIVLLAGALALMSFANFDNIGVTLGVIAGALLIIAAAANMMPATLPLIAVGLLGISVALGILAGVIVVLSSFDTNKLFESLFVMLTGLAGIALVMSLASGFVAGAAALLIASVAFVVAAGAMVVFAISLRLLKDLPLTDLALGIAAVGGALIVLALGLVFMTVGLVGAAALALTAGGLIALGLAFTFLQGADIPALAGGLALLGLALVPLGIGGVVLMLGVPGLMAGSIAIAMMGAALIPFAFALKQLEQISFVTMVEYLGLLGGTAGILALLTPVLTPLSIAIGAFGVACLAAGAGIDLAGSGMVKIAESILSIPENTGKAFKNAAKEIADSVIEFEPAGEKVVKAIDQIGYDMVLSVSTSNTNIGKVLTSSISANLGILSAAVPNFKTGGYNIVVGIANGVYSGNSIVVEAMHFLAEAMITQFRHDFDMHSPSVVMEEMTAFIPIGAARGVENASGVAVGAMDSLAFKMVDSIRNAMTSIYAIADGDFSLSPVITPVVDMSNVDSAAGGISELFGGNAVANISRVGRSMADLEDLASNMQNISEARANMSQDSYEINIYPSSDMDEEAIAEAVVDRISSGITRKGVALG